MYAHVGTYSVGRGKAGNSVKVRAGRSRGPKLVAPLPGAYTTIEFGHTTVLHPNTIIMGATKAISTLLRSQKRDVPEFLLFIRVAKLFHRFYSS